MRARKVMALLHIRHVDYDIYSQLELTEYKGSLRLLTFNSLSAHPTYVPPMIYVLTLTNFKLLYLHWLSSFNFKFVYSRPDSHLIVAKYLTVCLLIKGKA